MSVRKLLVAGLVISLSMVGGVWTTEGRLLDAIRGSAIDIDSVCMATPVNHWQHTCSCEDPPANPIAPFAVACDESFPDPLTGTSTDFYCVTGWPGMNCSYPSRDCGRRATCVVGFCNTPNRVCTVIPFSKCDAPFFGCTTIL